MVTRKSEVPDRGDVIMVSFSPQSGHEQAGRRPGVVLSPRQYNEKIGLAIVCPVTSKVKGFPFEVELPPGMKTHGVVLADHVRSIDWRAREATIIEKLSNDVLSKIQDRILVLIRY